MRKFWKDKLLIDSCRWSILAIFLLFEFSCAQKKKETEAKQFTCPMHPEIIQDKPGACPICFMDLVQKNREGSKVEITTELNYLLKPTDELVMSRIKAVTPSRETVRVTSEFNGVITYDTRRAVTLSSRIGGRVEKLYIKYKFQPLSRGQKILEIYSPELMTAQRELIYLTESDAGNTSLINAAKEKLKLLGVTDGQIAQVISSKKEIYSFPVFSQADGYALDVNDNEQKELSVREGMYLAAGQSIIKVANTDQVWAEFDVPQREIAQLSVNDSIRLNIQKNSIVAKVNFVQPFFEGEEKFIKVRVYLNNAGDKYRIGQLVSASIAQLKQGLWIPKSARLDVGNKEVVFVKEEGAFKPKLINTKRNSGDKLEVIQGLNENDSIAYDAHFLIDSESFVKIKE